MIEEDLQSYEQLQTIILFLNYYGPLFVQRISVEDNNLVKNNLNSPFQ